MTAAWLLADIKESRAYSEFFALDPLPGGGLPEDRMVLCGMSWNRYLAFDKALGDNRPVPRFYYLDEELEIMTTSKEHERVKTRLTDLTAAYFEEANLEYFGRGQATMRLDEQAAGAEPDMSWCIGEEKEFPDLVLEVALTSGGVRKLDLYRRFRVPEVWIWRDGTLETFFLEQGGEYKQDFAGSRLLPKLDVALLVRCVATVSVRDATSTLRAGSR